MLLEVLLIGLFIGLVFAILCAGVIGCGRVEKWGIVIAMIGMATLLFANQWLINHPLWDNPKGLNGDDFDRRFEHFFFVINLSHAAFWTAIAGAFVIIAGSAVRIGKNRERLFPFLFRAQGKDLAE